MTSFREACWVFWMVKGHLNSTEDTIRASYDSYLRRLWHNHEECQRYDGFEECFRARCSNIHPTVNPRHKWRLFRRFTLYNSSWQDQETIQQTKVLSTRSFIKNVKLCPSRWCQEAPLRLATRMMNSPSFEMHRADPYRSRHSRDQQPEVSQAQAPQPQMVQEPPLEQWQACEQVIHIPFDISIFTSNQPLEATNDSFLIEP